MVVLIKKWIINSRIGLKDDRFKGNIDYISLKKVGWIICVRLRSKCGGVSICVMEEQLCITQESLYGWTLLFIRLKITYIQPFKNLECLERFNIHNYLPACRTYFIRSKLSLIIYSFIFTGRRFKQNIPNFFVHQYDINRPNNSIK